MARIITLTPNPALDFSFEVERVESNQKLRCAGLHVDPGGGGINVARAAKRLGADVLAIYAQGGVFGARLAEALAAENVPCRIIPVATETRPAFHARETSTGREYRFNFPGEEMAAAEAGAMLSALEEEAISDDYVVASGSLPPGAPNDFWARATRIAKAKSAHLIIDTTTGVEQALAEGVSVLRLNKSEAPVLAGRPLDWPNETTAFARSLVDGGKAARVVITQGGEGGVLVSKDGAVRTGAPKVPVVSAVGAGDSFVGALTVALIEGRSEEEALRFAFAAAAATLMTPGTALFDPSDVQRIFHTGPG